MSSVFASKVCRSIFRNIVVIENAFINMRRYTLFFLLPFVFFYTFHRKLFPLPVVLAFHPRLKLLPGAFPGSNHFAECLFGHGGASFLEKLFTRFFNPPICDIFIFSKYRFYIMFQISLIPISKSKRNAFI